MPFFFSVPEQAESFVIQSGGQRVTSYFLPPLPFLLASVAAVPVEKIVPLKVLCYSHFQMLFFMLQARSHVNLIKKKTKKCQKHVLQV